MRITALIGTPDGVVFETLSRYKKARELAGKAEVYALVLTMLDGPDRQPELSRLAKKADDVFARAKTLPVDVRVTGDVDGQIKAAFAGVFTGAGFRTGNRNSRFALEAVLTVTPVEKNQYFNARYTVDAGLKDTQTGAE
ncbi:MAG: hypothetical protein LBP20_09550 [Treponema sp.]|nr:hypothetical protein [Treponema sp.]